MLSYCDAAHYKSQVQEAFAFLETEREMTFAGVRRLGDGDERETGLVARYRAVGFSVEIGCSEVQQSIVVLIHLRNNEVPRLLRHVYLDSFVEFITEGKEQSIVPQIYPRMTEAAILDAMQRRQELFDAKSLGQVLRMISERLRLHLDDLLAAKPDLICSYHEWVASRRGARCA